MRLQFGLIESHYLEMEKETLLDYRVNSLPVLRSLLFYFQACLHENCWYSWKVVSRESQKDKRSSVVGGLVTFHKGMKTAVVGKSP